MHPMMLSLYIRLLERRINPLTIFVRMSLPCPAGVTLTASASIYEYSARR